MHAVGTFFHFRKNKQKKICKKKQKQVNATTTDTFRIE